LIEKRVSMKRTPIAIAALPGGQGYGAHHELFVNNYGHDNRGGWMGPANAAVHATAVDKIFFLEKGAPATDWSYPWFHVWQDKWISGGVAVSPGVDPGTPRKDGGWGFPASTKDAAVCLRGRSQGGLVSLPLSY
jgi:hypothetical protein